jgi:hypothetical protein
MTTSTDGIKTPDPDPKTAENSPKADRADGVKEEIGGPKGLEPTRYGDWEVGGRCSDF